IVSVYKTGIEPESVTEFDYRVSVFPIFHIVLTGGQVFCLGLLRILCARTKQHDRTNQRHRDRNLFLKVHAHSSFVYVQFGISSSKSGNKTSAKDTRRARACASSPLIGVISRTKAPSVRFRKMASFTIQNFPAYSLAITRPRP